MSVSIQELIDHPEKLDKETLYELRSLLARYPYYQTARLLYVANLYLLHDATFNDELCKAALSVPNRKVLYEMVEGGKQEFVKKDTAEKEEDVFGFDRTLTLIDSFLSTLPQDESRQSVKFDPSTDYVSYLMNDTGEEDKSEESLLQGHELIDGFIEKADEKMQLLPLPQEASVPETSNVAEEKSQSENTDKNNDEEVEDSCFTETLAKIYIKQQKYSKALEIIKKLSLNNPKKIAYFADQIRFLEKLIINNKNNE